jgi:thiol-disulfide isomerase/thioredoxin
MSLRSARASIALIVLALAACDRGNGVEVVAGAGCPVPARRANLDLTLQNPDGANVRLADFRNKVLFVNFWATWCVPCRAEIPVLIELQDRYRSDGLEVLGLVVIDDFANAKPYADKTGINYTVLDATSRKDAEAAFGEVPGLPTSFVLTRDGTVCFEHVGVPKPRPGEALSDAIRRVFEAEIKALL